MNKQQIALKLVLDQLGLGVNVASFDARLILQKGCYLGQAAGVNLGYYFGWYLHGPYCSSLAKDAFAISDELDPGIDETDSWKLDDRTISRLAAVRAIMDECSVTDPARKLELLASIHFLVTRKSFSHADVPSMTQSLKKLGKKFTESEVASAIEGLAKHGFIPD